MNIAWWITGKELPLQASDDLGGLGVTTKPERQRRHHHMPPPLRPRALNRWLRRINLELEAAHRVRMARVFDDLATHSVPLKSVSVFEQRPPLCGAVFLFSNGVRIRLTRCELRAVTTLSAVPPGQVMLERVLHNGTFWALCFRDRTARMSIFSSDALPN
jgi:hypothetical protein